MIVGDKIATTNNWISIIPPLDNAKGSPKTKVIMKGKFYPIRIEIINQNCFIRLSQHLFPSKIDSERESFFFSNTRFAVS